MIGQTRANEAPPRARSVPDAAKVIGISRSAAYRAVERGEIPAIRIGRRLVVPEAALRRLLGEEGSR